MKCPSRTASVSTVYSRKLTSWCALIWRSVSVFILQLASWRRADLRYGNCRVPPLCQGWTRTLAPDCVTLRCRVYLNDCLSGCCLTDPMTVCLKNRNQPLRKQISLMSNLRSDWWINFYHLVIGNLLWRDAMGYLLRTRGSVFNLLRCSHPPMHV